MPKRSDAAEYVAPAIEVLPKPTCNMSSRPSLSTSCASLPGWTVRRWPRLVVPTSQPYNSRPDEFATSVNVGFTPTGRTDTTYLQATELFPVASSPEMRSTRNGQDTSEGQCARSTRNRRGETVSPPGQADCPDLPIEEPGE